MEQYRGRVLEARLDTMPIPPGQFPTDVDPRGALSGDWDIEATFVKGASPSELAPVVDIYDGEQREVLLIGAQHEDLVYRERSRARLLKLDQPDLRLPDVLAKVAPGDTVVVRVARRGFARCLRFQHREACPELTPGRSWSLLLYPEFVPDWVRAWLDLAWMFILFLPLGFWSERVRDLGVSGVAAGALVGLAVAVTRLGAPSLPELCFAGLGLLVGHAMRIVVPRGCQD
jgi:hypothetical protein